jgi:hypothetical protein
MPVARAVGVLPTLRRINDPGKLRQIVSNPEMVTMNADFGIGVMTGIGDPP